MDSRSKVLVFGDGVPKVHDSIRKLYRIAAQSANVNKYLSVFSTSLQASIKHVPRSERAPFLAKDLLELSETHLRNGSANTAVTFLLTSGVQLGWLFLQLESESDLLKSDCQKAILGLCMGLLPALAAAVSTDSKTLLQVVPETIRLSLVLGLHLVRRGNAVEQTMESWASVVFGVSEDEATSIILDFHESSSIPAHKRAWISTVFPSSLTISAPPSTLNRLNLSSERLSKASKLRIPAALAIHAPHIDMPDVERIVETSPLRDMHIASNTFLISPSSDVMINTNPVFQDAFIEISKEIFARPMRWERIEHSLQALIGRSIPSISVVGHGGVSRLLRAVYPSSPVRIIADEDLENPSPTDGAERGEVAIIGMAGRFPGADTLEAFWHVLESGLDLHRRVPPDRFDVRTHHDPSGKTPNSSLTEFGCFLDRPGHFDRKLFHMSPAEAKQTDPMQRLQLLTTYEALEMAGYGYDRTNTTNPTRVGTFFGQSCDDWRQTNASQEIDSFYIPGGARAFGPGRVSYHFGWEGPSYSIDTACSASIAAIHLACNALRSHECDTAIASAANLLTTPDNFAGLTRGGFVSPTGASKTLDENADGYCRADAVGTLILKRLENALLENDNLYAVVKSTALNSSAKAISITHPHAATQADLFKQTLRQADLLPDDIDHFELHGTGTKSGDMAETTAIMDVFAGVSPRPAHRPLSITAVKPNVGHSEAASGLTSIIKSLLMLRNSKIPPHIGIKTAINRNLPPLADRNIVIPSTLMTFSQLQRGDGRRRIMVNNLNAGGGNACIILEDPAVSHTPKSVDPRRTHVVAVSAQTLRSFKDNLANLLEFLDVSPAVPISDLAYTTTARRIHHRFRIAYVASDTSDLAEQMRRYPEPYTLANSSEKCARVVFIFPGQGSQKAGMARELFAASQIFRASIEASARICRTLGYDLLMQSLMGSSNIFSTGQDTIGAQLALVAFEIALAAMWQSLGLIPEAVVGHSIGEYAALCVAGVLSVTDTYYLIYHRAQLLIENGSSGASGMLSVIASATEVGHLLERSHLSSEIVCLNSPGSIVLGGPKNELLRLKEGLLSLGIKSSLLEVPYAFHTKQMDPILSEYATMARQIQFDKPRIPFGSTLLGRFITSSDVLTADYLVKQTREPVQFSATLTQGHEAGLVGTHTNWFELGPSPTCLAFVKSTLGVAESRLLPTCSSLFDAQKQVARSLSQAYGNGIDVSWSEYHREYEHHLTLLELPSYAFDLENYWIQYRGDWSLLKWRKDLAAPASQSSHTCLGSILHSLVDERSDDRSKVFVFEADTKNDHFRQVAEGYAIDGQAVCPSTVYVEMVWEATSYIQGRQRNRDPNSRTEFTDVILGKELLLDLEATETTLRLEARTDEQCSNIGVVILGESRSNFVEHARCKVIQTTQQELNIDDSNVFASIDRLQRGTESDDVYRLSKSMVYRLFSPHIKYDKKYQGVEEVYVDKVRSEALAIVLLETTSDDTDDILYNPVWLSTICHVSDFLANEIGEEKDDFAYALIGWKTLSLKVPLEAGRIYQSYVTLRHGKTVEVLVGDLHVIHQGLLVARILGIEFQRIPKTRHKNTLFAASKKDNASSSDSNTFTPASENEINPPSSSHTPPSLSMTTARPAHTPSPCILLDTLRRLTASQLEIPCSELSQDTNLADLGLNSIMGLSILSTFGSETGMTLPSAFFYERLTLADARAYFDTESDR
ncbi:MAG: hypothetical protein Q9213_004793 [Squamulea squamosa]